MRRVLGDVKTRDSGEGTYLSKGERMRSHSEEYKTNDREEIDLTSERNAEIWEWKVTTAKAEKEMWSILCSLTTDQKVPNAGIITSIG